MYVEDVNLARESLEKVTNMIELRMTMIEKVDVHPLSWPVATEFQKMKRARCEGEDDKLFAAAEKKVKEDRKSKNDEAMLKTQATGKQRINFVQKSSLSQGSFGNVARLRSKMTTAQYKFCFVCSGSQILSENHVVISLYDRNYGFLTGNTEFLRVNETHGMRFL